MGSVHDDLLRELETDREITGRWTFLTPISNVLIHREVGPVTDWQTVVLA